MNTIFEELLQSLKQELIFFGLAKDNSSKETEFFEYAETRRQKGNLRRTMLFTIFVIIMNLMILIVPVLRAYLGSSMVFLLIASVILMIVYIEMSQHYYKMPDEEFENKKVRSSVSNIYIGYWCCFYFIIALSASVSHMGINGFVQGILLMFVAMAVPVMNRKEQLIIMPVAVGSAAFFAYFSDVSITALITGIPAIFLWHLVCRANHIERLEHYYDMAFDRNESNENKRRLSKVFEEVFDLAFEVDIENDTCDVLRSNEKYGLAGRKEWPISEFFERVKENCHSDDYSLCAKNFSLDYLNNEFLLGRSQIYFEMRLKSVDGEYSWVSVLITKEEATYQGKSFLLCLMQDIEERKKNEDKLRLEAEKDPLTQLYNKMTTKSLIEECLEKNSSLQHALIIIDIDNFKTINDTRGHVVGDQILLAFAAELNKNFRETDILGRTGGDEFIVLIKNVQSIAMVCDKLQRLTSSFKKYGIDHGFPGRLSTSIGVSMFNKDGKTYEELFKKADAALYEAKRNGKDQYKFSISRT